MLPSCGSRSAASHNAKSSAWSWRHDQHVRAAGQPFQHLLAEQRVVHGDIGGAVGDVGQPQLIELVLAGIDQVQLDLQPGQDPGQLVADVPDAEDRDVGRAGSGSSSRVTSPPQHCRPCSLRACSLSRDSWVSGSVAPDVDQLAGPAYGGLLEVAAADAAPAVVGADDHLRAGVPRGVAADLDHRDQHAGEPVPAQLLDGAEPVQVRPPPAPVPCVDGGLTVR